VHQQRRRAELGQLSAAIAATVVVVDEGLARKTVMSAVERVAPRLTHRRQLAALVDAARLGVCEHQPVLLARLVAELGAQGATALAEPLCDDCDAVAMEPFTRAGHVRCRACAERCPECAVARRRPGEAQCRQCRSDRQVNRGTCGDCGGPRRVLDAAMHCRWCRERATRVCDRCRGAGSLTSVNGEQLCWDCTLRVRVDALLPEADHGPSEALRQAILTAANSRTTARWLRRERVAEVLGHVGGTGPAITHEDLDALGSGPGVEHLRDLLVAAGALDGAGRAVACLEAHAATSVAGLADADRRIVAAWVRWRLLPRLRRREEVGKSMANSLSNARAALHEVTSFARHLQSQGRSLRGCTQADLNEWLARPGAARRTLVAFVAWAAKKKLMPALDRPASQGSAPAVYADSEDRWAIARRLVRDHTLDVADRVAGALVVLYGQPLARIVSLRLNDVRYEHGRVVVVLGDHELELPEPFATLVDRLPVRRRGGPADQVENPWLFPGSRGGRHMTATSLGQRLRAIGIEPRRMRGAALAQLSAEMAPAVLADAVGISPGTAVKWTNLHGGNWASYAAGR
jgi:hypothetical protein